jgi:hypothetical protein
LSVADAGDWAVSARRAYQALSESYLEDDPNSVLLATIKEIFDRRDAEFLTSKTLAKIDQTLAKQPPSKSFFSQP